MEHFDNGLFHTAEFKCVVCGREMVKFTHAGGGKALHWVGATMICPTHYQPERIKKMMKKNKFHSGFETIFPIND